MLTHSFHSGIFKPRMTAVTHLNLVHLPSISSFISLPIICSICQPAPKKVLVYQNIVALATMLVHLRRPKHINAMLNIHQIDPIKLQIERN